MSSFGNLALLASAN